MPRSTHPPRSDLSNKYCRSTDLTNEASVESFFVLRLLADLNYEDREIKTKRAIDEVSVSRGGRTHREPYKPDYLIRPWSVKALSPRWDALGVKSVALSTLVEPVEERVSIEPDTRYGFLRITYEGQAEPGETRLGREISYSKIGRARAGDIVVSNISAVYRAICVMPADMEHLLVSNEFTVLRPRADAEADAYYIWSVLRTAGVIAEWLSGASGVGRHRVDWEVLQNQQVPLYPYPRQKEIGDLYREIYDRERETKRLSETAAASLIDLDLEGDVAKDRLARAKPPR